MSKKTPMTPEAAARIHSAEAIKDNGKVSTDSFTSRVQKTVAEVKPKTTK
ncbi:hypothetical protein [Pseudomonas sp. QC2]|jgi:hypothetical protein|nr:hypothetical protein [Pseudomonas sp. QC2]